MRLKVENIKENPASLLRRAGYAFQRREGEEMSFIRPMARSGYPRFHMYAHVEKDTELIINFHLDQKRETYGDDTRHHGEYENEGVLAQEAERIMSLIS